MQRIGKRDSVPAVEETLPVVAEYFNVAAARMVTGRKQLPKAPVRLVRDVVTGRDYHGRLWTARELVGLMREGQAAQGIASPGRAPMGRPWVKLIRLEGPREGVASYLGG